MTTVKRRRKAPEKKIQWAIIRNLRMLGFHVTSFSQPFRARQTLGIPDLFVSHRRYGQWWIEVKAPGNTLTIDQRQWAANATANGVKVMTAWSLQDVLDALGIK